MQLEQEFIETRNIIEYSVDKQFFSKKNRVHLVRAVLNDCTEQLFVVKEYPEQVSPVNMEASLLVALDKKGLSVPKLYYKGKGSIVMEYIRGATLVDALTDAEYYTRKSRDYINIKGLAEHLARWLDGFYRTSSQITGKSTILQDINLRNFLLGYKLYGIDFEDCREGLIEEDMGRLLAFIVTYEPAFTTFKMGFAREVYYALAKRMPLNRDRVIAEASKEFDAIRERRDMMVPEGIAGEILLGDLTSWQV